MGETLAGGDVHLVGEHDALGVAGGAGGVDEHGDVVGGDRGLELDGGGVGEGLGEAGPVGVGGLLTGGADEELEAEAGSEGGGFLGGVEERGVGDEG